MFLDKGSSACGGTYAEKRIRPPVACEWCSWKLTTPPKQRFWAVVLRLVFAMLSSR